MPSRANTASSWQAKELMPKENPRVIRHCQRTHDAIHVARPTEGKASRISVHKDEHEEESLQSEDETAERQRPAASSH